MPRHHRQSPGPIRVFILLSALVALFGCSFMQSLAPGETNPPGGEASDPSSAGQEPAGLNILDESDEPPRYAFPDLGAITFRMDPDTSTSRQVSPDDPLVEMQLVDAAGLTWTLSIPAGALETTQTLKMIALADLQSDSVPGLVSGIALEPDGLQFRMPLQLRVRGPGLDAHTLLLHGTQTGQAVDYALHDLNAPEPAVHILHFSSYFASRPDNPQLQEIYQRYHELYAQALKEARALSKKEIQAPEPPSIPLECTDSKTQKENGEKTAEFVKNAMEPEHALIVRILSIRRVLALTGVEDAGTPGDVERMLMDRLSYKASEMMKMYQGQEEKLTAIADFTYQVAYKLQLLHAGGSEKGAALMQELTSWYERLVDDLLDDVSARHNYKKIPLVLRVARNAKLLGAANRSDDTTIERLERALHFDVQVRFDMTLTNMHWVTEGTVQVQFQAGDTTTCSGGGQASYSLATMPEPETIQTSSYPLQVVIKEFDPCEGTVKIGIDRFGADFETYISPNIDDPPTEIQMPLVSEGGRTLYEGEAEAGMYWFTLKVQNENATAAEEHFERSTHDEIFGDLTITLVHTPQ